MLDFPNYLKLGANLRVCGVNSGSMGCIIEQSIIILGGNSRVLSKLVVYDV